MRAIAFNGLVALALLSASCVIERRPLPPPGPPIPAPPPPAGSPAPPQSVRSTHPPLVGKRFVVVFLRAEGDRREIDDVNSTSVVNLLAWNGIVSRKASRLPTELPARLLDAARATAEAYSKSGEGGDVFLLGEVKPGKDVQVRIAAVDLRTGKVIDNFGNQGPPERSDEVVRRTLEETLSSVESHFGPAEAPPPPPNPR